MFADLNVTFTALAEVARPFIQESISEGVADRGGDDRHAAADPAAASPTRPACSAISSRPRSRCARPRRRSPPRSRRATPILAPLEPAQPRSWRRPSSSLLRLTNNRRGPRRDHRRDGRHRPARPGGEVHRPGADGVQLPGASSPRTSTASSPAATTSAPGSGSSSSTSRRAPTARAARRPGSPTAAAPTTRTSCTRTRIRTPRRPGRSSSARPGNEPFQRGQVVFGNPPGNQGTNTKGPGRESTDGAVPTASERLPTKHDPGKPAPDPRIYGRHYTRPVAVGRGG